MRSLTGRSKPRWSNALPVLVAGVVLTGCSGESPSSPSGDAPPGREVAQTAAAQSVISVSPRNIRLRCNQGFGCGQQVIVTTSSPVNVQIGLEGDFVFNFGATSCPLDGSVVSGSCTIGVAVGTTEFPGRRSGTLTISETTSGTSKTVRLAARVS
jgi:hypothetical protein